LLHLDGCHRQRQSRLILSAYDRQGLASVRIIRVRGKDVVVDQYVRSAVEERLAAIVGDEHVVPDVPPDQTIDWWPLALKNDTAHLPRRPPSTRVSPATPAEVASILRLCAETRTPVTTFGGGSGVVGAAVPWAGGVLLDMVRLRQVRRIDRDNLLVSADAGLVGGHLEEQLRALGYTLGLYPQSLNLATLGGWVASGAIGAYSGYYGGIEDRLVGLEVALADGTLIQTPVMPRWSLGPNLAQLFVGSEGTLGVITGVTLRMARSPRRRLLRALRFATLSEGVHAVRTLVQSGLHPAVVRLYDQAASTTLADQPERDSHGCLLLLGFDGPERLAEVQEELTVFGCIEHGATDLGRKPAERWDAQRLRAPTGFAALRETGVIGDYIDLQAPWDRLLESYQAVRSALMAHSVSVLGYFTHVSEQGSAIYFAFAIEVEDDDEAVRRYHLAWNAAIGAAFRSGATIAHNRGIGLARAPWFAAALGDAWPAWERLKRSFDPLGILNPGKLGPPLAIHPPDLGPSSES
jgi:alkyldihydroxyacetonephosphate synthase